MMVSCTAFVAMTVWSRPFAQLVGESINHLFFVTSQLLFLFYSRPIEGRIIHALGKTWHPEVSEYYLVSVII